jgi:outer membrane protein OmpA-like peptidoglycan-associated protein
VAVNLFTLLQNEFSGDAVSKLASFLGESPSATQSAVASAVPALLGALASKANTPQGAGDLLGMMQRGGFTGGKFGSLGSLLSAANGAADLAKLGGPLLGSLLGGRQSSITDWVASSAGVSKASSSSLLSLALPFLMNFLGKQLTGSGGLNAGSLTSLLASQIPFFKGVPAGLTSALGIGRFEDLGTPARVVEEAVRRVEPAAASAGSGILKWLLPLLALGVLFFGVRACRNTATDVASSLPPASTVTEPVKDAAEAVKDAAVATAKSVYGVDLGAWVKKMLPSGIELNLPELGVEQQLLVFITDASKAIDKDLWFSFDRLEFETGSAVLKPTAQEQLRNVAEILKAYPAVKIKIGGYTDNTGDDAQNMKLSQDRAGNTMKELVTLGIAADRLEAEGYGEQYPVASNDTDEGRQRNRRIDMRVTAK